MKFTYIFCTDYYGKWLLSVQINMFTIIISFFDGRTSFYNFLNGNKIPHLTSATNHEQKRFMNLVNRVISKENGNQNYINALETFYKFESQLHHKHKRKGWILHEKAALMKNKKNK